MAQYKEIDGWIEEVEEVEEKDEWNLEIDEEDDEETIRLKQRLKKAEADLRVEQLKNREELYAVSSKGRHKPSKKPSPSFADKWGYDKERKGFIEQYVEDEKTKMYLYIGIIVFSVIAIVLKFLL